MSHAPHFATRANCRGRLEQALSAGARERSRGPRYKSHGVRQTAEWKASQRMVASCFGNNLLFCCTTPRRFAELRCCIRRNMTKMSATWRGEVTSVADQSMRCPTNS